MRSELWRISAALLATAPVALSLPAALARWLPIEDQAKVALATLLPLPLYVTLACLAGRARSGVRVWIACAAAALLQLAL